MEVKGMRKGQTAMEYLMTYGWAILIIIVVVAALYSLGVFSVTPAVSCSPCFSYFSFVDYAGGTLVIRNGPRTISFDTAGGDVVFDPAGGVVSDSNTDGVDDCCVGCVAGDDPCSPARDIEFTAITSTSGVDVEITISYTDQTSGIVHTDSATLHNR